MGSQIFDYWFDPSRFVMEHYVDGDLLDANYPTQRTEASPDNLHVWGKFFAQSPWCPDGCVCVTGWGAKNANRVTGPDLPPTFLT